MKPLSGAAEKRRPPVLRDAAAPGMHSFAFLFGAIRGRLVAATIVLCLLALGAQCLDTMSTVALRHLVNAISQYLPNGAAIPSGLLVAAVAFVGCAAGSAGFSAAFLRLDIVARKRLLSSVERTLFAYTLWHAPRYFEQRLPGEIAQQVRNAGQAASGLFNTFTYYGMRFVAMLVSAALVFSASIPALNIVTLIWTAAFLVGSYYITKTCAALSKELGMRSGHVVGRMVDSLRNISGVRSFGRQSFEESYVGRYVDDEKNSQATLRKQFFRLFVFQLTCKFILNVLVIGWSLHALLQGSTDVGSVAMLITLAGLIASLVQEISNRMYEVFDNFGTLSNALSYLLAPHAIQEIPEAAPLSPGDASIRFENVGFRYPSGSFGIENLDLHIKPGEKVGLIGPSGSGKSTIFRLLKREYDPDTGRVLIGGQDIRRCTVLSLAEVIGEVPQQPRLFNRSIRENIAYGRPAASDGDVWLAAEAAHCVDFIQRHVGDIDADAGEDGNQLSGGERQRLSIARAVLKDAPILLLDEASSGLDPTTEASINENLARLMEGKTVIAVAHRFSTLEQLDRIVVVVDGRIVEQGTPAELLTPGRLRWAVWESPDRTEKQIELTDNFASNAAE